MSGKTSRAYTLSNYVAEASEEAANTNNKLKIAGNVRDVSNVMDKLWPDQAKAESPLNLSVLSQNTVISIDSKKLEIRVRVKV
jgi:hypothetical protein